ncbi:hypothetical protein JCM24511_08450 [Saitozyma sp. JCM 24511]|nr:hypothetical protein JCM24511_08450 [Saitozyma sp. JCM 24511]
MVSRRHYSASVGSLTEDELQSLASTKRDDSVATNVISIQSDDLSQIFAEFSENYAQMPGANGLLKMVKARLDSAMTPDHDDDGQSHAGSESSAELVDDDTVIVENGHHHTPGSDDRGFIHLTEDDKNRGQFEHAFAEVVFRESSGVDHPDSTDTAFGPGRTQTSMPDTHTSYGVNRARLHVSSKDLNGWNGSNFQRTGSSTVTRAPQSSSRIIPHPPPPANYTDQERRMLAHAQQRRAAPAASQGPTSSTSSWQNTTPSSFPPPPPPPGPWPTPQQQRLSRTAASQDPTNSASSWQNTPPPPPPPRSPLPPPQHWESKRGGDTDSLRSRASTIYLPASTLEVQRSDGAGTSTTGSFPTSTSASATARTRRRRDNFTPSTSIASRDYPTTSISRSVISPPPLDGAAKSTYSGSLPPMSARVSSPTAERMRSAHMPHPAQDRPHGSSGIDSTIDGRRSTTASRHSFAGAANSQQDRQGRLRAHFNDSLSHHEEAESAAEAAGSSTGPIVIDVPIESTAEPIWVPNKIQGITEDIQGIKSQLHILSHQLSGLQGTMNTMEIEVGTLNDYASEQSERRSTRD